MTTAPTPPRAGAIGRTGARAHLLAAHPYTDGESVADRPSSSAKDAVSYLRQSPKATKCSAAIGIGDDVQVKVMKFKVKLGDQSLGYTVTVTFSGQAFTAVSLVKLAVKSAG